MEGNIILVRTEVLNAHVIGVEQKCVWHSPDGFEWGYGGSGPADLALNILEEYFKRMGFKGGRTKVFKGTCFKLAARLHQQFKWDMIAPLDRAGAVLSWNDVHEWVQVHATDEVRKAAEDLF